MWPLDAGVVCTLVGPVMMREGGLMVPEVHAAGSAGGVVVARIELSVGPGTGAGGGWEASGRTVVEGARLWTADEPWLYTAVFGMRGGGGACVDCEACRVGFRDVRVEGNKLLVNGRAVEVRGVNRHEFDDLTGRHVSRENIWKDLTLMKRLNINAVRTSHYPNSSLFYSLCDAIGMYVCDEANIESHGLAVDAHETMLCTDPAWEHAFLDRMQRMVCRDKNHACVIMWSLGNESGYGPHHDVLADWTRRQDPSRPVVTPSFPAPHTPPLSLIPRRYLPRLSPWLSHLLACCLVTLDHTRLASLHRCMSPRGAAGLPTSSPRCTHPRSASPSFRTRWCRTDEASR